MYRLTRGLEISRVCCVQKRCKFGCWNTAARRTVVLSVRGTAIRMGPWWPLSGLRSHPLIDLNHFFQALHRTPDFFRYYNEALQHCLSFFYNGSHIRACLYSRSIGSHMLWSSNRWELPTSKTQGLDGNTAIYSSDHGINELLIVGYLWRDCWTHGESPKRICMFFSRRSFDNLPCRVRNPHWQH